MRYRNFEIKEYGDGRYELIVRNEKSCFTIAFLEWDKKEDWFELRSVGTRYLEYREGELETWLLAWCKMTAIIEKEKGGESY